MTKLEWRSSTTSLLGLLALLHKLLLVSERQRQNIGTALLSQFDSFAEASGAEVICANPFTTMTEASSLLEKQETVGRDTVKSMPLHEKELYREHWEKWLEATKDFWFDRIGSECLRDFKEKSSRRKMSRL